MSRIGRQPILLPEGVSVTVADGIVAVSGPKGSLERPIRPEVGVRVADGSVFIEPVAKTRQTPALWGLTRALVAGMVDGVSQGVEKKLEIEGVGYRAVLDGQALRLSVGFSHPLRVDAPPGITFRVEKNTIAVTGVDKELVGDVAARIRNLRPPEPYKGKGIRYAGEVIRRKAGKKAVTTGA